MSNTVKLNTCPKCSAPIPAGAPQGLCPKCVMAGAAFATDAGPPTATGEIPSLPRVAAAFPQLEIQELIGRGGMGFVFKARQPGLDRLVALKLLPDKLAKDASFTERFNREGRVLGRLNHPNIVSIYDFGQTGGFYFLLMEYVDGVNLRQAMQAGRFSPAEALAIVPKICEALQYAHEQGILHRDIKPENILLDARGRVKIADFGIAKLTDDSPLEVTLTGTGSALGTPHYMAPEQLEKPSTVDHRADIYSLGVVFYEMLTGELPIGRFAAPSAKTPVGANVDEVVFRTLEKEPGKRFQSAGEMKTRVEHLGTGSFEQPEAENDAEDEAPRSWLEAIYSMRLTGWFLAALCLVNFAFPHVTRLGNSPANTYSLGLSRPWLVNVPLVDAHHVVTREWRFVPSTTSFGAGMFGLLLVAALLVLRHRVRTAPAIPRSAARISNWSIYGAISVGLSLAAPMKIFVSMLTGLGGVGPGELWLALGSVALPGLGGTLLGWLALNEIRESRGRVKGLPLAMFATLFWPLTILGALTIGLPMFLVVPGGEPSAARMIGRFLVLVLPAAVIAFSFWTIHATARWASQQQVTRQRGLLKWVFIVVLVVGMGAVLAVRPVRQVRYMDNPPGKPVPIVGGEQIAPVSREKQDIEIRRAKERFAEAQARFEAKVISRLELAKAERDLAVAEARDDASVAARARLKFAELNLTVAQQHFSNQVISTSQLRDAETERDLARVDLADALKASTANGTPVPQPIRANFRVAKGQAVTFEVVRGESEQFAPIRGMAGFIVAPDDERGRFSVVLTPELSAGGTNRLKWRISVIQEDGSASHGETAELGELLSMVPTNHLHTIEADSSFGLYLTHAYPTAETNGFQPRTELSLAVRSQARGRVGASPDASLIGLGSTNWAQTLKDRQRLAPGRKVQPGEVLASQWLKSPVGTNTTNWIRFTFTNVELRNEDGQQWLGMGYVTDVRGDCEEVFRVDSNGFMPVTRKTSWRTTPPGSPPVDYTGIQWLVPPDIDAATLQSFRKSVEEALVGKSFVIPEGEQRPLLRFPVGKAGDLSVGIGAKRQLSVSTKVELEKSPVARNASAQTTSSPTALEFRLVADGADTTSPADELPEKQRGGGSITHRVLRAIVLDGSSVARAGLELEPAGSIAIAVELSTEGARQFGAITTANLNRRLAIVADGNVLSAPIIRSPIIGGEVRISGVFSEQEAYRLVKQLNRFTNELSFGEMVVLSMPRKPVANWRASRVGLDLETGRTMTNAAWIPELPTTQSWLLDNGVDLMTETSSGHPSFLESVQLATIPASKEAWENLQPEDVRWHWTLMRAKASSPPYPMGTLGQRGTYLFRTREMGFGLLEIIGSDASASIVKLRYKLVRPVATQQP